MSRIVWAGGAAGQDEKEDGMRVDRGLAFAAGTLAAQLIRAAVAGLAALTMAILSPGTAPYTPRGPASWWRRRTREEASGVVWSVGDWPFVLTVVFYRDGLYLSAYLS
jgi:hypothetical protein